MEKSYKITITTYGPNPNYEAEKADFNERQRVDRNSGSFYPNKDIFSEYEGSRMKTERVLEVYLTEQEYRKLKSETIKIFE